MDLYLNIAHDFGVRRNSCNLPLRRKHRNILGVKDVGFIFLNALFFLKNMFNPLEYLVPSTQNMCMIYIT